MLIVSDAAEIELKKVLGADTNKGKELIVTFQGVG